MPLPAKLSQSIRESCIRPYHGRQAPATEPTALAAMAAFAEGEVNSAKQATDHLASRQQPDGSVGVTTEALTPKWSTSLAMLAWATVDRKRYAAEIERGANWLLGVQGTKSPRTTDLGHDTELVAWPWAEGTHSWLEPTALAVMALRAAGHSSHPRILEAEKLLIDRLLPEGGCNYGNTSVLGQTLRPHVQPTGIVLLAIRPGSARANDSRVPQSVAYLRKALKETESLVSRSWALLALFVDGMTVKDKGVIAFREAVETTYRIASDSLSPHAEAVVAHALLGPASPLVRGHA